MIFAVIKLRFTSTLPKYSTLCEVPHLLIKADVNIRLSVLRLCSIEFMSEAYNKKGGQLCCRLADARAVLEACHSVWPEDVLCQGYLGLTLKLQGLNELAIPHLLYSVQSDHQDTVNSRFYFHLGDALQRNKQNDLAISVSRFGVFLSSKQEYTSFYCAQNDMNLVEVWT